MMNRIAARLFSWLQGADFYRDVHQAAVELVAKGDKKIWLDVGCGPGLVARLAAARGYQVLGIDAAPHMVQAARHIAQREGSTAEFKTGDVFRLPSATADVVSAASLLAVLSDKTAGLTSLWQAVRPGGVLLIIEPTEQMTRTNVKQAIKRGLPRKRINGLRLWATARQGTTIDPKLYEILHADAINFTPLLYGLVGVWIMHKKA